MHNAYQKAITKMIRCFEVRSILENNKIYKYYMKLTIFLYKLNVCVLSTFSTIPSCAF